MNRRFRFNILKSPIKSQIIGPKSLFEAIQKKERMLFEDAVDFYRIEGFSLLHIDIFIAAPAWDH